MTEQKDKYFNLYKKRKETYMVPFLLPFSTYSAHCTQVIFIVCDF